MARFHDAVTRRCEGQEQRARERRQCRIRAFDEDPTTTSGRLRASQIHPAERCPSTHDEPCASAREWLQHVFPCDRIPTASVGNRQHEIPWRIDSGHNECVRRGGNGGHDVARHNGLQRRHDSRRTWPASVVDRVPAVPARAAGAHLRDPRPHLFGWRVNGDRVCRRENRVRNYRVDRKRTAFFEAGCDAGGERHDERHESICHTCTADWKEDRFVNDYRRSGSVRGLAPKTPCSQGDVSHAHDD